MNKRIFKIITIIITIFIIAILGFLLIVSQDEYHLGTCHEDHCIYCEIIHIAQTIFSITIAFIITIVMNFLIYFFLSILHKIQESFMQLSLVFQKVQLNE